jgi:hypothetical protein
MDPFTIALATFGVQKLRGKSTKRSLRDALLAGGIGYGIGQMGGAGLGIGQGAPLSSLGITAFTPTTPAVAGATELGTLSVNQPGTLSALEAADTLGYTPAFDAAGNVSQAYTATQPTTLLDKAGALYGKLGPAEKIGLGVTGATLLAGDEEDVKPITGTRPEDYAAAQAEADKQVGGMTSNVGTMPTYSGTPYDYASNYYRFNKGGIVDALPRFNTGGINYMPSKQTHDENDVHNYVRAQGYVEDGSGNGDKDEDTILAQLADGEFVSRADAILGAGIMEGASPSSMKDMRKKGAAFFYDQQSKFKRVYDLLNASRKDN